MQRFLLPLLASSLTLSVGLTVPSLGMAQEEETAAPAPAEVSETTEGAETTTAPAEGGSDVFAPQDLETFDFFGKLKLQKMSFPNGLKLLVVEDHSAPVFNYATWFHVGSSDEVEGKTGIAHLFEHMMFKQTEDLAEGEFDRTMEQSGSPDLNAWTWLDETVYPESLPADKLDMVARLEASRMQRLVIDKDALDSEREVVINERRYRTDNDPDGKMDEVLWKAAFLQHPYGWPTIGWEADLNGLTVEDCQAFYKQYYTPNNATIIVVGDVTVDQVVESITRYYKDFKSVEIQRPSKPIEPEQLEPRREVLYLPVETDQVLIGYKAPKYADARNVYLELASYILADGDSSRFERFLKQKSIVGDYSASVSPMQHDGLFQVSLSMREGRPAEEGEFYVQAIIDGLATEGPSQSELDRARNQYLLDNYGNIENAAGKASWLGFNEVIGGDHRVGFDLMRLAKKASIEEIQQTVAEYLTSSHRTTVVAFPLDNPANIGPQPPLTPYTTNKEWKAAMGKGVKTLGFEGHEELFVTQEWFNGADVDGDGQVSRKDYERWRGRDRIRQVRQEQKIEALDLERSAFEAQTLPEFGKLRVSLPDPVRKRGKSLSSTDAIVTDRLVEQEEGEPLPGGHIVVMPDRTLGVTYMQIIFPRGAAQDPEGKEGLANAAVELMLRGTANRTREQFTAALEQIGGTLSAGVSHDTISFSGRVLTENWPVYLALVRETLISPAMSAEELKSFKEETIAAIQDARNDDRSLANQWFRSTLMAGTGYGHEVEGSKASLESITVDDINAFLEANLVSAEAVVGLSGRVDAGVTADMEALLQTFDRSEIQAPKEIGTPAPLEGRRVLIVDKPERTQTQILIGQPGLAYGDADYPALWLSNNAFGGGNFSARMMVEVRVKRGWSYGAYAYYKRGPQPGYYAMWFFPASKYAAEATQLVLDLAQAYAKDGITADERTFSVESIVNAAAFETATASDRLGNALSTYLTGEDRVAMIQELPSKDLATINETVARRFNPANLLITVVGTASEIKDAFAKLPGVTQVDVVAYDAE